MASKRLLAVIFLLLIIIPLASAANESINFNYPSSVECGESFSVSLDVTGFSEGVYDVKIDVLNSDGARIAQILNNGDWKSTYYYIDSAINTSSSTASFDMNVTKEYSGSASINVTLRKGSNSYKFGGYSMSVEIPQTSEVEVPIENSTNENSDNENINDSVIENSPEIVENQTNTTMVNSSQQIAKNVTLTKTKTNATKASTKLTSPPVFSISGDSNSDSSAETAEPQNPPIQIEMKDDKIKTYSIYLFTATLLILTGYLIKLQLVPKKE